MSRDVHADIDVSLVRQVEANSRTATSSVTGFCRPWVSNRSRHSHQHRKHGYTLFSKSNSANPQQRLDRGRAIPRRMRMHRKRLTDPF